MSGLTCGECFAKYALFSANLFFALVGLVYMGLGIGVQLQIMEIVDLAENYVLVAPIASIMLGAIIFSIAFLGCCGACRESRWMLISYAICVLVVMLITLALAILIFVKLDNIVEQIPEWLNGAFTSNPTSFQDIERAFDCCGPNGFPSYGPAPLPNSCCPSLPCTTNNAFPGCNKTVQDFFDTFGIVIAAIGIVLVAIELVAAVFALCLSSHVSRKYKATY